MVFQEKGRGRKPCVCGVFIGVRSRQCSKCGHVFARAAKTAVYKSTKPKKEEVAVTQEQVPAEPEQKKRPSCFLPILGIHRLYKPYIAIPNTLPPIQLKEEEITEEGILQWARKCAEKTLDVNLTIDCLAYWIRMQYPIFIKKEVGVVRNPTFKAAIEILSEVLHGGDDV